MTATPGSRLFLFLASILRLLPLFHVIADVNAGGTERYAEKAAGKITVKESTKIDESPLPVREYQAAFVMTAVGGRKYVSKTVNIK